MSLLKRDWTDFCRAVIAQCLLGLLLPAVCAAQGNAASSARRVALTYTTDRTVYTQGDVVRVTVTNLSEAPATIVDRAQIDGGFATVERLAGDGRWQAIALIAVANVTLPRTLQPGERHQYHWPTIGYNRADTIAPAGTYRIRFGEQALANVFEVKPRASVEGARKAKAD